MAKTYVITGAASGIGNALIKGLSEDNIVFAGYRKPENKASLELISKNIYPFYIDFDIPSTIIEASEYINSNCKKIDTLINIAGCVVGGPIECIDINEIRRQFNTNVFGHIELTQSLIKKLENGRIINISSMASFGIFPFISPYCASKKCLDMLFNSFLIENKKNIKVISIKPGVISTPLWEKSIKENSVYYEKYKEYSQEMNYVLANAKRNESKGLSVNEVVKTIIKADNAKNPKLSYTVGTDALCAHIVSLFPQSIINNIVKLGIKIKIFKNR